VLAKRIIPCLDVDRGRVVKGTRFVNLRDAGDPVEVAARYEAEGADELVFLDITASHEQRDILLEVVRRTAEQVFGVLRSGRGVTPASETLGTDCMAETSDTGTTDFEALLALMADRGASDLHLKAGRPPILRVEGEVAFTDRPALDAGAITRLAEAAMGDQNRARLRERGQAGFSCALPDGSRFRVSVYRQRGRISVAVRRVSRNIPTFGQLHLPAETMQRLCRAWQGLVIFTGVTGTGKSTSIAACLDFINARRRCHIITIEDPIEYLLEDKEAFVDQREIGTDVPSYEVALESLLREDPDVVLVGEMRSPETVEGVPATEVLLATPAVRSAIRSGETDRLPDLISAGAADGMHDLTQDLARLVREEWVQPGAAYEVAPNPEALKVAIHGIEIRKGTVR